MFFYFFLAELSNKYIFLYTNTMKPSLKTKSRKHYCRYLQSRLKNIANVKQKKANTYIIYYYIAKR